MSLILHLATTLALGLAAPDPGGSPPTVEPVAVPGLQVAAARPANSQKSDVPADPSAKLLDLAQQWVTTWNEKDVDGMQKLHDDDFLYGVFGRFMDGQELLRELRKNDFWGVTYSLKIVDPKVRILSTDTAMVLFQLIGNATGPKGVRPYASLFTLVYQKRGSDWKIVHVHDSEPSGTSS